jgi:hypothetical protein
MHFNGDSVVMTERNQLKDLLELNSPFVKSSPFVKRSQRYDIAELMNSQKGVLNSPAVHSNGRRLDADSLHQLPGGQFQTEVKADMQSMRSKRSLSINVSRVSKIIKMHDDGATAISRHREHKGLAAALRHKSVERAVSRGRGNGSIGARPLIESNLYQGNVSLHFAKSLRDA